MTYPCIEYDGSYHEKGSNALFADGHVKLCTHFAADRMTFSPTSMSDWM